MTEEITEERKEEKRNLGEILIPALAILLIITAGVVSGYFLSARESKKTAVSPGEVGEKIEKGMIVGVNNPQIFRDTAVGIIEINDGSYTKEGSHKLIREGGESQTAYLTSSVLDLGQFIGRKVRVWGETFAAQKAGWFMDVGKVEVLE